MTETDAATLLLMLSVLCTLVPVPVWWGLGWARRVAL